MDFAELAKAAGYVYAGKITDAEGIRRIGEEVRKEYGPRLYEIPVTLESRADLCRPAEKAVENKQKFMEWLA